MKMGDMGGSCGSGGKAALECDSELQIAPDG